MSDTTTDNSTQTGDDQDLGAAGSQLSTAPVEDAPSPNLPALGVIGNVVSIQAALLSSAVVLAPTVALYGRFFARERGAAAPVPTTAD